MVWLVNFLIFVAVGKVQELIPGSQYVKPVMWALIAGIVGHFFLKRPPEEGFQQWRRPFLFWVLFSIGIVCSIPLGLYPSNSITFTVLRYGTNAILLFLVASHLRHIDDLERTSAALVLAALTLGAALFVMPNETMDWDGRIRATVGETYDPNDLALLLVMTVPYNFYGLWRGGMARRALALVVLGITLAVVYKTGSRGGMLSLGLVMVYATFFVRQLGIMLRGLLLGGILLGGAAMTQTTTFHSLISGLQGKDYNSTSDDGRIQLAIRGIGYALQRPLWGVGVANFQTAEGLLSGRGGDGGTGIKWSTAHNSYVEVVAETGFITFTFYFLMLLTALRELKRQARVLTPWDDDPEARRVLVLGSMTKTSLLAYMLGGFFLSMGYFPMLYLVIGYTLALGNIADSLALVLTEEDELAAEVEEFEE